MKEITVRNERKNEYRVVEELTREAFWNLNTPGCEEHYLVHVMRDHKDFIPELDFVAEIDGKIVGNIIYTKAKLADERDNEKTVLTFGPISVLPEYQRKGIGKALLNHSFDKALELGYDAIFDGRKWIYHESPAYEYSEKEAVEFDKTFEPKEKEYRPSQEEFYIYSHSSVR